MKNKKLPEKIEKVNYRGGFNANHSFLIHLNEKIENLEYKINELIDYLKTYEKTN